MVRSKLLGLLLLLVDGKWKLSFNKRENEEGVMSLSVSFWRKLGRSKESGILFKKEMEWEFNKEREEGTQIGFLMLKKQWTREPEKEEQLSTQGRWKEGRALERRILARVIISGGCFW